MTELIILGVLVALAIDIGFAVSAADEARSEGRDTTFWFLVGVFLGPFEYSAATFATKKYSLPPAKED